MAKSPSPDFSNDRPETSGELDRLNRLPFAKRIARVLLGLPKGSGLVIGIHGPWGDGKTTVLNYLRTDLDASTDTVAVDFNPWRFTDEPTMLAEFFRLLAGTIRARLTTRGEDIAKLIETVGLYASVVYDRLEKAAKLAGLQAEAGLEAVRRRLSEALEKADKRIVILIDDIDRLDKHETHTLFRLIKACADFPNVCYVLAFDDTAVAKSLGERYGGGDEKAGRSFLEKIIQIPLKLPVAAKEDLRLLCFEQVDRAIEAAEIELTGEQAREFVSGFDQGVAVRLTTPRAAKRFGNGLMFALPMLKGEANAADVLLVEALRAFYPEVYDTVRENHDDFSGVESDKSPRSVELLKPLLDAMPKAQADAVKALLIGLFPRLSGAYGGSHFRERSLPRWAREQRISSPEYCPRYFTYCIPNNDISDEVIKALLDAAKRQDKEAVGATFASYLTEQKARRVIEKLRASELTADPIAAETLALALARFGKNLPNYPSSLASYSQPFGQAAILISLLLQRISSRSERVSAAKEVVDAADPLWFGSECLSWMYTTDKPEKQDSNTLTAREMAEVRQVLVKRAKASAAEGSPLFDPDVPTMESILFEWWRAEGRLPVQAHLVTVFTKTPEQVARFLQLAAPGRPRNLVPELLTKIGLLIDLDTMAELIRRHCPGDFEDPQWYLDDAMPLEQRLAEQFMVTYNQWKNDGVPLDTQVGNFDDGLVDAVPDGGGEF